jgi:SMI1 / KNR4 family (SUKH-1)
MNIQLKPLYFFLSAVSIFISGCTKDKAIVPSPRSASPFRNVVSHYNGSPTKWQAFLECWWAKRRGKVNSVLAMRFDDYWLEAKRAANLNISKNQQAITALEANLKFKIPPSYRDFILATGGSYLFPYNELQFDSKIGKNDFYQPLDVGSFKKVNPKDWALFRTTTAGAKFSQEQYYRYGYDSTGLPVRNDSRYNSADIDHLILVGSAYLYGNFLLNPLEATSDGELEAWNIYENLSGAARYRSFAELMQDIYFNEINEPKEMRGKRISEDTCALILFDAPLSPFTIEK